MHSYPKKEIVDCIICKRDHLDETVEHIVPRSLGNIHYVLPKGKVCKLCNNRFAKFEHRILNATIFFNERVKLGVTQAKSRDLIKEPDIRDFKIFLLKIFYESIVHSRPKLLRDDRFEGIRKYLNHESNLDIEIYHDQALKECDSIPKWMNRFRLKNNQIELCYSVRQELLWFHFRYAKINLVARVG